MLLTLIRKEFLLNIMTARFLVAVILCEALIISSVFILRGNTLQRQSRYVKNLQSHNETLEGIKVFSQLRPIIDRPPSPLGFMCIGVEGEVGDAAMISYDDVPHELLSLQGGDNPLLAVFSPIDIARVIQVVLSLLAVLLVYDSISGERERGTLSLSLSNPIPRGTLMLGKYLGGMATLTASLLFGLLSGLLIVLLLPSVPLNGEDWVRIGLIFISSLLYLSFWVTLGLFISARSSRSSTSLMVSLFLWLTLVVLLPDGMMYLAGQLRPIQDRSTVDAKVEALNREMWKVIWDEAGKYRRPKDLWRFMKGSIWSGDLPYALEIRYAPRENLIWYLEGIGFIMPLKLRYARRKWEIYVDYERKLKRQRSLSDALASLSPGWLFYRISEIFSGTDPDLRSRFMEQARRYREEIIEYARRNGGLTTLKFFTRMNLDEAPTYDQLVEMEGRLGRKTLEEYLSRWWREAQPLRDIPRFVYRRERLSDAVIRASHGMMILALLNLLFFLSGFVTFVRRPVR
ncbi:ABC transporter permease subunit [Candidatus Poribacteria bacterium]|nr:ABC transporter permease subunit [Candidatus Poribacteria bacterium]